MGVASQFVTTKQACEVLHTEKTNTKQSLKYTLVLMTDGLSFIYKQLKTNWTGVTQQYTVLQETEKTWQILNRPKLKRCVFKKIMEHGFLFCGNNTLTEGVFVNQPSSNVGN